VERPDWITEVEGPAGTSFLIRQRRDVALQLVRNSIIVLAVLIWLAALCGAYADHHVGPDNNSAIFTIVFIVLTVMWGLATLVVTAVILPVYFTTKDWVEFCIGAESVTLIRKVKSAFPDRISRDQISEFFVFSPQGQNPALTVTVTTTIYPTSVAGALAHGANQVGSIAGEAAMGMAKILAQFRYGININARGTPVALAAALSSSEADFLFFRLKSAFARPASSTGVAASAALPASTALPNPNPPWHQWAWLPIVILAVWSLRWVVPALEPKAADHQEPVSPAEANRNERQRYEQQMAAVQQKMWDATDRDTCGVTNYLRSGGGHIEPNVQMKNSAHVKFINVELGRRYPVQSPLQLCKVSYQNRSLFIVADPGFNQQLRQYGDRHAFVYNIQENQAEPYVVGTPPAGSENTDTASAAVTAAAPPAEPQAGEPPSGPAQGSTTQPQQIERPLQMKIDDGSAMISRTLELATMRLYTAPPQAGARFASASGETIELPAGQSLEVDWCKDFCEVGTRIAARGAVWGLVSQEQIAHSNAVGRSGQITGTPIGVRAAVR
jgi:hypothetical protein